MHRSASTSRASDEFSINLSPASKGSPGGLKNGDIDKLPLYSPISDDGTKKETKSSSPESVIHFIPILLIFCALILWVFSHPVVLTRNGSLISENIQGLSTTNGHANQTGLLPAMNSNDLDQAAKPTTFLADKLG